MSTLRPEIDFPEDYLTAHTNLSEFVDLAVSSLESGSSVVKFKGSKGEKIGEVFVRSVLDAAICSQVETVEKRYGLSLAKITSQLNTLRAEEILAFACGILNPSDNLSESTEVSSFFDRSAQDVLKKNLAKKHFDTGASIRGQIGHKISSIDFKKYSKLLSGNSIGNLKIDRTAYNLKNQTFDLNQLQEVMAKSFGTSFLEEGMRIPLPSLIHPVTGEKITETGQYQVYKKISKEGLMAFALRPIDAPDFIKPLILFRPTATSSQEKDALKTIAEDMHDDVGKPGFIAAKQQLEDLLMDPCFTKPDEKAWVTGFSLGGAHAARLLAFAPNKFSKAFFFNDPSTEQQVAEEFAKKLMTSSHSRDNPLEIKIFHNEGDDVTLAGAMHVGYIPSTCKEKDRAQERCHVSYVKIQTAQMEDLDSEIHSLALVDVSFRNLLSLANRTVRVAAKHFAKTKKEIHCQIVLSSFNQKTDEDPTNPVFTIEAPRERADSDPKSPRSPKVRSQRAVEVTHLDKSTCELAVKFNKKRLSRTIKCARRVTKAVCLAFQDIKNFFKALKTSIRDFFARFSRSHKYSYIPLLEEKLERIRGEILAIRMTDFLSIPEPGNKEAQVQPIDFSILLSACGIPVGFSNLK